MIDLLPNAEQQAIIDSTRAFLRNEMPLGCLKTVTQGEHSFDRDLLLRGAQLGWLSVGLHADMGGASLSVVEEALLYRELGRALAPGPFLPATLASHLAASCAERELVKAIVTGEVLIGLGQLDDEATVVIWDSMDVEMLLLVEGSSVRLVKMPNLANFEVKRSLDPTYYIALVDAKVLAGPAICGLVDGRALINRGGVLVAALLCGLAEQVCEDSVSYGKERVQFDRPIGSFQAVKHRCADMAFRAEAAWSQTVVAALLQAESSFEVAAARFASSRAAIIGARENIQNHGGIGYTEEATPHLYLKRAHLIERFLVPPYSVIDDLLEGTVGW